MDPPPNTKWNHNILNKYNNQTKNKNPRHNTLSTPQPSRYNRVETFDTSPLQLPLLNPLFHFNNSPPVLQNKKELGNNTAPPNQKNEAFANNDPDCDDVEDEDDVLVSDAAKPKYESTYTPRVGTINITDTNLGAKLEEPQVENNPFSASSMNTPVSEVKTKPETFTSRWSSIIETLDSSGNKQSGLDDINVDTDKTYKDSMKGWSKIGEAIREYNPLGMLKKACIFVYDDLFVRLFASKFQQSLYGKVKEHYFMFIYLLISILVTYNLFYLYFYKDFQNERIPFLPVEKLNGFYILDYVINPVKLIYSNLLLARDFIEDQLDEAHRKEYIGKYDKYKIIIVMLFLVSILFVTQFMNYLYNSFFNTLSLKKDEFGNYVLLIIVVYSFYCFGKEICNDPILRFWPVLIVSLIRFIVILIISTSFSWITVFLICIIIFLSTVFPWMIIYSTQGFEIFQEINGFCDNLQRFKRIDKVKLGEDMKEFIDEKKPDEKDSTTTGKETTLTEPAKSDVTSVMTSVLPSAMPSVVPSALTGSAESAMKNVLPSPRNNLLNALKKGGGNCIEDDPYDKDKKGNCYAPKTTLDNIGFDSKTFYSLIKMFKLYLYKRTFYIAFLILIIVHGVFYFQNVHNRYSEFRYSLIAICSTMFFSLLFLMVYPDTLTRIIGKILQFFTALIMLGFFFGYNVVIYKIFSKYSKYGATQAGVKI